MADMGNLFVVAAPSGAGKTSLVKAVVESMQNITVSISHTTRPMRPGEVHGTNYYFIDKTSFQQMIAHQDFLEHAVIFDNLYGTSKSWVAETLAKGIDVILEIDWQGQQQIKALFPQSISLFILPPSFSALKERLIKRNQDLPEIIEKRLADARDTISHLPEFDYLIINDDFATALADLKTIIEACRLLERRQSRKYGELINGFLN
jgi:guanylate kinase